MRRSLRWLSVFVAITVTCPPALAQPKKPARTVSEELPADARREWNAGLTLMGESNFRGAVVQFQRVYDMTKNPRVLPNLALAHKGANDYARAVRTFERALAEGAAVIPAKDLQDIKDSITALRPYVSTLEVITNAPGAMVNIAGEDVGTTPLPKPVEVSAGEVVVRVSKDGFRDQTRTVSVSAGKPASAKFELTPERVMALVSVTIEGAPKANIRIDSVEMGAAPFKGQVEVGKAHTFEAYAPGYTPAKQTLEVTKRDAFSVVLPLSASRNEGRVAVIARPKGAFIEIDQREVGSDKWEGPLSASGGHRVRIHKDGYIDEVQEISVAPDQVRTIDATLRQDPSRGTVYWAVGALLVVGGGVIAGFMLANKGREDAPVSGSFNPPTQGTWFHR